MRDRGRILLVDPRYYRWGYSAPKSVANFGLLCVATFLQHHGYDVEILDMNAQDISWWKLPEVLREKKPDVVGVPSSMNCYVPEALFVAGVAKTVNPNVVTVGGGINFTLNGENILRENPQLDFIVRGDGEYTILDLVKALEIGERDFSKIAGLTWRNGDEVVRNPDRPPIEDLDSLPLPNWDLVDLDHYCVNTFPPQWGNQVLLTTSRGCPYRCRYCAPSLAAQKYRELSAERALEMIRILRRKYDRRMIWINDLVFGVNEERTEKLLEGIVRENLGINICVDMTPALVVKRKKLLPLMRRAGVRIVMIGAESPNEEDHEIYGDGNKGFRVAEEAVKLLRENKILPGCYFMIGELHHTPEKIRRIREYAEKLNPVAAYFCFVAPHPGTPYYEEVKEHLATHDLSRYGEDEPVLKYPHFTDNEIRMIYREVWISFYAKPTRLLRGLLFGSELERWFYKKLAFERQWHWELEKIWRMHGWEGFGPERKKLKKWARKALGLETPMGRFEEALKNFLKLLGKIEEG